MAWPFRRMGGKIPRRMAQLAGSRAARQCNRATGSIKAKAGPAATRHSPNFSAIPVLPRAAHIYMKRPTSCGEVAEWLNAPHSKCGMGATPSGVQIPPSPPFIPEIVGILGLEAGDLSRDLLETGLVT